jgi:hypothetical protein
MATNKRFNECLPGLFGKLRGIADLLPAQRNLVFEIDSAGHCYSFQRIP